MQICFHINDNVHDMYLHNFTYVYTYVITNVASNVHIYICICTCPPALYRNLAYVALELS